jgi:hypothetical protein
MGLYSTSRAASRGGWPGCVTCRGAGKRRGGQWCYAQGQLTRLRDLQSGSRGKEEVHWGYDPTSRADASGGCTMRST